MRLCNGVNGSCANRRSRLTTAVAGHEKSRWALSSTGRSRVPTDAHRLQQRRLHHEHSALKSAMHTHSKRTAICSAVLVCSRRVIQADLSACPALSWSTQLGQRRHHEKISCGSSSIAEQGVAAQKLLFPLEFHVSSSRSSVMLLRNDTAI
jgi:hypothetical protein